MTAEQIAEICHEANRAYCRTNGDYSHLPWMVSGSELRESAIAAVRYALAHPAIECRDMHSSWKEYKVSHGWKYGPVKDSEKKEHPCIVDYADLPDFDKKKDVLFLSIVRALQD